MYSMQDIIFENINDTFSYGLYGDIKVIIMKSNGYINATNLCKLSNKRFDNWLQNKNSQELINELSSPGIPGDETLITITGGAKECTRGTYVNPLLIPHISSWASPKFAIKISKIINEYFINEYKRKIKEKDDNIKNLCEKIDTQNIKIDTLLSLCEKQGIKIDNMNENIEELKEDVNIINDKLDFVTDEYVIPTIKKDTLETFILLKNINNDKKYKTIRCQNKIINYNINKYKDKYEEILRIPNPNVVNLLLRVKEKHKNIFKFKYNDIEILKDNINIKQIFEDVNNEKKDIINE